MKYIPDLNRTTYLSPVLRRSVDFDNTENYFKTATEEEYLAALERFEIETELKLKDLLSKIGIRGVNKYNRKELPANNKIETTRVITSFVNEAYETDNLFRAVVKHCLDNNLTKIRFYIDCEHEKSNIPFTALKFKFTFNFYTPNN